MGSFRLKIKDFEQKAPGACQHGTEKKKTVLLFKALKVNDI